MQQECRFVKVALFACSLAIQIGCGGIEETPNPSEDLVARSSRLIVEATDWSGRLHIQVVDCTTTVIRHFQTLSCSVDPSFVLVGGGARTDYFGGSGALLTETRPVDDGQFRTWQASSKDHINSNPHNLKVFAIGMRLDGVARGTLVAQMQIKSSTDTPVPAIGAGNWQTSTDEGYTLLGGGAFVNWTGEGALLTRSSPDLSGEARTWIAAAKDHNKAAAWNMTVYAIGIRPLILGFGSLEIATRSAVVGTSSGHIGDVTARADGGWVNACPGAFSDWSPGEGRLLFGIVPTTTSGEAMDKDHIKGDVGTLYGFVRQIRVMP